MKTRTLLIAGTLALAGCSSPQSKARGAEGAQRDANEKVAYADQDTQTQANAIQRKADEDAAQVARENAKKNEAAQSDADKKWSEAAISLQEARMGARDDGEKKLAGFERDFADLKPRLAKRLFQAELTTVVNDVTARSQAVRASIGDLATATADNLEPLKGAVAQRLVELDQAIGAARKL